MHEQQMTTPSTTKQVGTHTRTHTRANTTIEPKRGGGVGRSPPDIFAKPSGYLFQEQNPSMTDNPHCTELPKLVISESQRGVLRGSEGTHLAYVKPWVGGKGRIRRPHPLTICRPSASASEVDGKTLWADYLWRGTGLMFSEEDCC